MTPETISALFADLEADEGRIPHLYLCPAGRVTIARGHRVWSVQEALALPLEPRDAIVSDWEAVRAAPAGMLAHRYGEITRARMSNAEIDRLTAADIAKFEAQLRARLPGWDGFPPPAQRALFNLGYNVGTGMYEPRSEHYWPSLGAAIAARDWSNCAEHCHRRPPISEARNRATAALFRAAAAAQPAAK